MRSVTGFKKFLRGKPCEDAVKVVKAKDGAVCAVADGHGDARCKYAHTGAHFAVETACEVLKTVLCENPTPKALYQKITEQREDIQKDIIKGWSKRVFSHFLTIPEGAAYRNMGTEMLEYICGLFSAPPPQMSIDQTREYYGRRDKFEELLRRITYLYGTTLNAVLVTEKYIFCLGLGDGDIVFAQGNRFNWLLPPAEQFSTQTESLCLKPDMALAAFKSIVITKSKSKHSKSYTESNVNPDFILISTDGLRNSFLDDAEFAEKIININKEAKSAYAKFQRNSKKWLERLSRESLYQDDISFVFVYG